MNEDRQTAEPFTLSQGESADSWNFSIGAIDRGPEAPGSPVDDEGGARSAVAGLAELLSAD